MTQDEIIALAKEAQLHKGCAGEYLIPAHIDQLTRFAQLVAEREREACAKVCETLIPSTSYRIRDEIAAAIRARSKT